MLARTIGLAAAVISAATSSYGLWAWGEVSWNDSVGVMLGVFTYASSLLFLLIAFSRRVDELPLIFTSAFLAFLWTKGVLGLPVQVLLAVGFLALALAIILIVRWNFFRLGTDSTA